MNKILIHALVVGGVVVTISAQAVICDPIECKKEGDNYYCAISAIDTSGNPLSSKCIENNGTPPPPTINDPAEGENQNNNGNTNVVVQTKINKIPPCLTPDTLARKWMAMRTAANPIKPAMPIKKSNIMQSILQKLFNTPTKNNKGGAETLQITGREFTGPFAFCHLQSPNQPNQKKTGICACEGEYQKSGKRGCIRKIEYIPGGNPECKLTIDEQCAY
jgi:hypothetical protein